MRLGKTFEFTILIITLAINRSKSIHYTFRDSRKGYPITLKESTGLLACKNPKLKLSKQPTLVVVYPDTILKNISFWLHRGNNMLQRNILNVLPTFR